MIFLLYETKCRDLTERYRNGYHPTGRDYEEYLAWSLFDMGYVVRITPASGDFGTDVVLDLNPYFRIIFQCKYYSGKIGNHAVQEICAAKEYYKAQMCVVVTNREYTEAAKRLAEANRVLLIDRFDIGDSVEDLCRCLGLIPGVYLDRICLQLNDTVAERDEMVDMVRSLKAELFECRVAGWDYDFLEDNFAEFDFSEDG